MATEVLVTPTMVGRQTTGAEATYRWPRKIKLSCAGTTATADTAPSAVGFFLRTSHPRSCSNSPP